MSILTVGTGAQYATIAAAVAASASGDTIKVKAGTYTNDFLTIRHSLTLDAVGGTVSMVATARPPNGKAIITEGGAGANITINGFNISGATVRDGNGAGIRYEGGKLTLNHVNIHDNQNGILAASDPSGSITIVSSTFTHNGAGDGRTHNIYVNKIGSLTVRDSTITNAVVGHQIKSRALSTTIVNNTISDGAAGTASYEIDLPNGGVAVIEGNHIQKGAHAQNPIAISYGEEGGVYARSSLTVTGNTMVNSYTAHQTTAVKNTTSITATVSGNHLSGWTTPTSGLVGAGANLFPPANPAPVVAVPRVPTDPVPVTPGASGNNATVTTGTLGLPPAPPKFLTGGGGAAPVAAATAPAAAPKPDAAAVPGVHAIVQAPKGGNGPAVPADLAPVPPAALAQPKPSDWNGSGSGASNPFPVGRGSVALPHHSSGHSASSGVPNQMLTFHT